ncbi:glycerophosphodiester phosphodiesterase [Acrocarpospora corrugata]|uniref:glycerophosphodiester phosphodiesterase n=1 Tax=Acrocarpospora corrugata TaxID=35763 RepID=UPI003CD09696
MTADSDRVEPDVRFTKDHRPVLMHDATVDRATTATGRVSDMTLAQFRTLRTARRPATTDPRPGPATVAGQTKETLVELKQVPTLLTCTPCKSSTGGCRPRRGPA